MGDLRVWRTVTFEVQFVGHQVKYENKKLLCIVLPRTSAESVIPIGTGWLCLGVKCVYIALELLAVILCETSDNAAYP